MFMLFRLTRASGRSLNIRTTRLLICGVLLNLPGLIQAADRDPATLTLPEAFARVLSDNPELAMYPYDIRAAEAQALQAGFRPNPRASVDVENIAGNGELSGTDATETTLALSQVIEMGGKRPLRRNVGQWRRQTLERDYELARLDVL